MKKKLMVIYLLRLVDIILYEKSGDSGGLSRLEEWQGEYVKEGLSSTERYDKLTEEDFHPGVFQGDQSTYLDEE